VKERRARQFPIFLIAQTDGIAGADAEHFAQFGLTDGSLIEDREGDLVVVFELIEVASGIYIQARFGICGRADENFAEALQTGLVERRCNSDQLSTDHRVGDFVQDEP